MATSQLIRSICEVIVCGGIVYAVFHEALFVKFESWLFDKIKTKITKKS